MLSSFLKFSQLILQGNVLRSRLKICLWIWEYYILNTGFIMFIATNFKQACDDNCKWFNHLILLPHHNVGRYTISQHPTKLKESEAKIQQVIKGLPSSKFKVTISTTRCRNILILFQGGKRGGGRRGSSSLYICIFRWSKVFIFRGPHFHNNHRPSFQ